MPDIIKYLPVPHGSIVVLSGPSPLTEMEEDDMEGFVEKLIVASHHDDFLILQLDDPDSDIDVITKDAIIDWLESRTPNPHVPLPMQENMNP